MKNYLHGLRNVFWLFLLLVAWPIQIIAQNNQNNQITVPAFTKPFGNGSGEIFLSNEFVATPPYYVDLQVKIKRGLKAGTMYWGTTYLYFQPSATETTGYDMYTWSSTANDVLALLSGNVDITGDLYPDIIQDGECLVNILNYYVNNSAKLSDDDNSVVEVIQSISNIGINLVFETTNPLTVKLENSVQLQANMTIKSDVTFQKEASSYNDLSTITLEPSGNLTLVDINCSNVQQNGGTLVLKRMNESLTFFTGNVPFIRNMTTYGGGISCQNGNDGNPPYYIDDLTIEGDVKISGGNQFDDQDWKNDEHPCLAGSMTINSGSITFSKIGFHRCGTYVIHDGTVYLDQCSLTNSGYQSTTTPASPCIDLKGGELVFDKILFKASSQNGQDYFVEVEGGKLTVGAGDYQGGKKAFIHLSGETAEVCINDGNFSIYSENYAAVYQEKGTLGITGGQIHDPICTEGGSLTISGGTFNNGSAEWNGNKGLIHILSDAVQVQLKGGHFGSDNMFYVNSSTTQLTDLLSSGYDFYSWDEQIQPDEQLTAKDAMERYSGIQVKPIAPGIPNGLLEAAKVAEVGPQGKDVKVIITGETDNPYYIPCELEINTAVGLAWFASNFYRRNDLPADYGAAYRQGASVVRLTADLDMSAYEWIPFQFFGSFDGQGHVIKGIKCHQSTAAFMDYFNGTLSNLVISGEFVSSKTDYTQYQQMAAGLCANNSGTIVNCGVEQSSIQVHTYDRINVTEGGLVASNYGSIQNSYMTGDVICEAKHDDALFPTLFFTQHSVGGLVGSHTGTLVNSYQAAGTVLHQGAELSSNLRIYTNNIAVIEEYSQGTVTNCTNDPVLENLNQAVEIHNQSLSGDMIAWNQWKIDNNRNSQKPIHKYIIGVGGEIYIDVDQSYQDDHAGKIVRVKSGVTYTIDLDNAWVESLILEDGAKLDLRKPLTISQSLELYREAITDRWTTLGIPSGLDVVVKNNEENGTRDIYFKSGYLTPSEQSWNISDYLQKTEAETPYLMTADHIDRTVTFYHRGNIVLSAQTDVDGLVNVPNGSWFQFVTNPLWKDMQLSGRAYVLNEEGNSFELQDNPVIPPLHAYLIASESVMKSVYSLRVGSVTDNEMLTTDKLRSWVENGTLCLETSIPETVEIYSISGTAIGKYPKCVGTIRVSLPKGIYIVVCHGEAIKVIL